MSHYGLIKTKKKIKKKRFLETEMEFSCVAWSGRGETPVGLARQLRPCRPKAEAAQREPHRKRTLKRKATSLFKETNKIYYRQTSISIIQGFVDSLRLDAISSLFSSSILIRIPLFHDVLPLIDLPSLKS